MKIYKKLVLGNLFQGKVVPLYYQRRRYCLLTDNKIKIFKCKMNMVIKESQGYSKEKALEAAGLDVELEMMKNATLAWKKAGAPMSQKELSKFMSEYVKRNKCRGAYLVIEPASDDTRIRPYSVINEATHGKRKTSTTYQIKEAELKVTFEKVTNEEGEVDEVPNVKVIAVGAVEARADKKDQALKLMKELIEANKKNYVVEIVKEVTEGQKYAGYGQYTPSKSAKLGKFMFFVQD